MLSSVGPYGCYHPPLGLKGAGGNAACPESRGRPQMLKGLNLRSTEEPGGIRNEAGVAGAQVATRPAEDPGTAAARLEGF